MDSSPITNNTLAQLIFDVLQPALKEYHDTKQEAYRLKVSGSTYDAEQMIANAGFRLASEVDKVIHKATRYDIRVKE